MEILAAPRSVIISSEKSFPHFRNLQLQQIVLQHNGRILLKNSCLIEGRWPDSILPMGGRIGDDGTRAGEMVLLFRTGLQQ